MLQLNTFKRRAKIIDTRTEVRSNNVADLTRHNFSVCSRYGDSRVQTGTVVGLCDGTTIYPVSSNSTVVGAYIIKHKFNIKLKIMTEE